MRGIKAVNRFTYFFSAFSLNSYNAYYLMTLLTKCYTLLFTKTADNEINRTHKRALRILFKDYDSSSDELLEKSESVKIHVQNLQKLMIGIYKIMKNLSPSYIWEFNEERVVKYDLRTKIYVDCQRHVQQNLE